MEQAACVKEVSVGASSVSCRIIFRCSASVSVAIGVRVRVRVRARVSVTFSVRVGVKTANVILKRDFRVINLFSVSI